MSTAPPPATDRRARLAVLLLLAVTAVWGSTFFLIRDLVEHVPSADFLAVRFGIAAVLMFAAVPPPDPRPDAAVRRVLGAGLGLLYAVAQLLQTVGLETTAASVSGFLTGTYIVLTPVLGALLLRDHVPRVAWVAAAHRHGRHRRAVAPGPRHGRSARRSPWARRRSTRCTSSRSAAGRRGSTALGLSTVQAAVIALICLVGGRCPAGVTLPSTGGQWVSLLYMAVVAGAGALLAQTWAQAHLTATRAAIVMAMEPVFAAALRGRSSATSR